MTNIYKIIRKKRNLRFLSVIWVLMLMIELFCPVFCDYPAFAAENNSSQAQVLTADNDSSVATAISACDHENPNHEQNICNDECLCHAVAIPNFGEIALSKFSINRENIAFSYGDPLFNSLPPPFQPPKRS